MRPLLIGWNGSASRGSPRIGLGNLWRLPKDEKPEGGFRSMLCRQLEKEGFLDREWQVANPGGFKLKILGLNIIHTQKSAKNKNAGFNDLITA